MRSNFLIRLNVAFLILFIISVLASGIYASQLLRSSNYQTLEESMKRELDVIAASLSIAMPVDLSEQVSYLNQYIAHLESQTPIRLIIINQSGELISSTEPNSDTNLLEQPELIAAQKEGFGTARRYSESLQRNQMFAARTLYGPDQQWLGYMRLSTDFIPLEQSIQQMWLILLIGMIVVMAIAGLISYRNALQLTLPLEKINLVAQQITNMNYKSRVRIDNQDEIGQLGHAINTMADSMQLQLNRIQENESRLKSVLENMISGVMMIDPNGRIVLVNRSAEEILGFTAKELLGRKYDEANQQYELTQHIQACVERKEHIHDEIIFYYPQERILDINLIPMTQRDDEWNGTVIVMHDITAIRRLERIRSEFVANVSHELKTPIAAVKGFAETLLAGAMNDKETAKAFLQIIFDESERLNRLIGDILELSKIESRRTPLHCSPVHLQSFISKALEMMNSEAKKKKIELSMQVPIGLYVEADEDRLRQILINLLSNGINYTPEGGRVSVEIIPLVTSENSEYERIQIIIADTGIGIPKKDIPRIFERFYRVDKARTRASGGTGLGLSIVKHLVELHKGTIRVESLVGSGSRFIIEIPVIQ